MRNIAKCLKCNDTIESITSDDYIICSCKSIAVSGGEAMTCHANDWADFARIAEDGSAFSPDVAEPSQEELLKALDDMIDGVERLPQAAMLTGVNHYDWLSGLLVMRALLRSFSKRA